MSSNEHDEHLDYHLSRYVGMELADRITDAMMTDEEFDKLRDNIVRTLWGAGYRRPPVGTDETKRTQVIPSGDGQPVGITEDMAEAALFAYTGCDREEASHYHFEIWAGMLNDMRAALAAAEAVRHG